MRDGLLVETIALEAAVATGAPIAATDRAVLAGVPGGALLVPRSGAAATFAAAERVAVDPRAGRCVLASDRQLKLLTF